MLLFLFFFSSRRRHTRSTRDWSSDVCSSDLVNTTAFHPLISAWAAKLPKDVVFKRVPVSFNRPQWINLARAYYALQATGDLPALDGALFHSLHVENLQLFDEPSLAAWVGSHGGDAE